MNKVSVSCRNLRLAYGSTEVLRDVTLDIEPGEFFALLGPSGSGKSTLLRLIAGFNRQQQGQVLVDGQDVGPLPPWERNIGMVFQSYALWPHLSVWDNVAFGLVERRRPPSEIKTRVGAALDLVGLSAYAGRRPGQLSGGQQQRVALARTIVIEPRLLLLDEPLSNLDRTLRVQMRQELLAMQRRLGLTTIFVTHDQEEAMTTADRMAVLDRGVVQQVGTPNALYDEPVNAFVAGFVGTMNLLPARLVAQQGDRVQLALDGIGELDLLAPASADPARPWQVGMRPHVLRLRAGGTPSSGSSPSWPAAVQSREFLGEFTRYHVRVGPHLLAVDQSHHGGEAALEPGAQVQVYAHARQLRVFNG